MDELNAWDAEGFTEKQIMGICKEIYPVGEKAIGQCGRYIAELEPQIWMSDPFKLFVKNGLGLCYDIELPIGRRFQKAYYM